MRCKPGVVIPACLASHNLSPPITTSSDPVQGSFPDMKDPIQKAWVDTFRTLQLKSNQDPTFGESIGAYTSPCSIAASKERSYSGVAYYSPAKDRPNLHLITAAHVEKIVFTEDSTHGDAVASGVQFLHHGISTFVKARKEVLLSSGVFGYENHYVGENLQDHVFCGSSFEVNDGVKTMVVVRDPAIRDAGLKQYKESRMGPFAHGPSYSFAHVPLNAHEPVQPPTTEVLKRGITEFFDDFPSAKLQYRFIQRMTESPVEATTTHFLARHPANYISTLAMLSHPFSRGHVQIKSVNLQEPPTIDFKYMSHPLDGEIYGRHMMFHDDLVRTEPLASLLKPNGKRLPPGKIQLRWKVPLS
ncbi:GMC oxidoreductase protein [Rutstroemia sp. NJR-2017a BVV2]|nr:GMC oxidoreductase protein [Rutstroemia sp. NJR-2017a BVV2]